MHKHVLLMPAMCTGIVLRHTDCVYEKDGVLLKLYVLIIFIILILYNKSTHKSTPYRKKFLRHREKVKSYVGPGAPRGVIFRAIARRLRAGDTLFAVVHKLVSYETEKECLESFVINGSCLCVSITILRCLRHFHNYLPSYL